MSCSHFRLVTGLLALFVFSSAAPAFAEKQLVNKDQGMEAHLFRSAVDTKGHFSVDATPILPHLAMSLGLMLDFGFNDWVAVEQKDKEKYNKTLIENYINAVLGFNLGLFDMIIVGIQIPLVIPSGQGYHLNTEGNEPVAEKRGWATKGGIGDIAIHTKLRWIRADRHAIGLGTVIQYQIPVSSMSEWLMEEPGAGTLSGKMILDIEPINWYRVAFNLGARFPFSAKKNNYAHKNFDFFAGDLGENIAERLLFKYGPMLTFGVGQSFVLWPGVLDFVLELYGNQLMSEFGNMGYFSMEIDAGFKLFIERNSYFMAGYAHGLPVSGTESMYGFQACEHRMFIGFSFEPSIGDKDMDGIKDDVDQCPDDPEDMDDFVDSDGCPDLDNDRDGILDVNDDCPLVPEDHDGDEDQDGCPERGADDRDGDGILDDVDKCPDDPEDLDQFEDENGCPDTDNDNDKILDVNDVCPNEPEDMDGWEDTNGCPDPDNDADRIPDVNDECPNEPETYNGKDDKDGCPDQGDVILTGTDIKILKKVYFEYDSAVIKEVSFDILDAVASTVINNPQIDKIEIQGHADERGDDDYNLRLTADRAAAVVTYLIKKGVKKKKVRSAGYGEYCPVDGGHNEAAWEKNRRVEFKVLSIDGQATGVETACKKAKNKGISWKSKIKSK
ncbi:MAG: OmpA family protein [Deltaproteobacteria bacterium]|nr:OmpA family protein [Deltaproteobacteria bacterium]